MLLLHPDIFHPTHHLIYNALDHRCRLLARLRPQEVERWLLLLLEGDERVLPEFYADKAVHFDLLGQVRRLSGDLKGAKDAFAEAFLIRDRVNGRSAAVTLHARNKRDNPAAVDVSEWTPY